MAPKSFYFSFTSLIMLLNVYQAASSCGGSVTSDEGSIFSPNYPNKYRVNQTCIWTITVSEDYRVELVFKDFELEVSGGCEYDYLEIRDGLHLTSPILGKWCGRDGPVVIRSSGRIMTVKFRSDGSDEYKGFFANFTKAKPCNKNITSAKGYIHSVNYPNNYGINENCTWIITVPENHRVKLKFKDFRLEKSRTCELDYVEIRDGPESFSRLLGKWCGSELPNDVLSSGRTMEVIFRSDRSFQSEGFYAEFTKVEIESTLENSPETPARTEVAMEVSTKMLIFSCGGYITSEEGHINSPNYPDNYMAYEGCTWIITVPENYRVKLIFNDFELELSDYCSYDYLEVRDGSDLTSPFLGRWCGTTTPPDILSSGRVMTVRFRTDVLDHFKGFSAGFQKVFVCGGNISSEKGSINSPNYPSDYAANMGCIWLITVPKNYDVILKFRLTFELQISENCTYDYVEILNGHDASSPSLGKFCGSGIPQDVRSSGPRMSVRFYTDGAMQYKGFTAEFTKDVTSSESQALPADERSSQSQNLATWSVFGIVALLTLQLLSESR